MLRIGVIGAGAWGAKILRTLRDAGVRLAGQSQGVISHYVGSSSKELPESQIQWVCVRRVGPIRADLLGLELVFGWQAALDREDVDAVVVATPASTHAEIVVAALGRGLHVFCEKPLAIGVADTQRIKDALLAAELAPCRRLGPPILQVNHLYLWHPAYEKLRELLPDDSYIRALGGEGCPIAGSTLFGGPGPDRPDCSAKWDWGPHAVAAVVDLGGKGRITPLWSNHLPTRHASVCAQWNLGSIVEALIFDDRAGDKLVHQYEGFSAPVPIDDRTPPLTRSLGHFILAAWGDPTRRRDRRLGIDLPLQVAEMIERNAR